MRFKERLKKTHGALHLLGKVSTLLAGYFNPTDGRFTERLERLVAKDGDLERVLRAQIGTASSRRRQGASAGGKRVHAAMRHLLVAEGLKRQC